MGTKNAIHVRRARDRKPARGARAPGFPEGLTLQCLAEAALSVSPQGRAEVEEFWHAVALEAWGSLD